MDSEGSSESKEKTKLALLSKEELISKCIKLLHISRQAQLAKQESTLVVKELQEKFSASEQIIEVLQREVKESNQIKDNVVKKLGLVSVETKQLIEQGEKLTTDIETLKQEKLKLYEELSLCQKQNGILSQNIGDLEVRLMQMNEVKGEMEFKINELNKKNCDKAEVSDMIRNLNKENMDLKQKNELHESENQIIQKTIDTLEKTLNNKEKTIKEYEERTKKLEHAEKEAKEKIDELTKGSENKIKNLQEILEEKEKTIEAHVETIAQLKENICDIDNEIKNVKNIVKQKDVELEKLPTSLSEKDRVIEDLKASIRDNEMSKSDMNSKDEKLEEMELEIEEKSNKLESLESELKETVRKCSSLEKQNEVNAEKINELFNELSNKNDAIEKLENDLIEKDRMFKITLQNKETESNQLLNSIQIELDDKVQQFVELDALLLQNKTVLEKTLDHVTSLENDLKVKDTDLEQAQNKIELLIFELDEKSILLKQLECDASHKDEKLEALVEELKNKEATIKDLESKVDGTHQKDNEKLEALEEKLKNKERKIQELEKDLCEKNTLLNTHAKELKDKTDLLQHLEIKLTQKDEVLFNLEKDLRQRDEKADKLENDLKVKEEQLDELKFNLNESKKNMQDTLIEELNTLERNYKETRSIIDALEATVKEKEQSIKTLEDTNEKLTIKLAKDTDNVNAIQIELATKTERITSLEQEMEKEKALFENLQKEISDKSEQIVQLKLIIKNNEDSQREKSNYELEKNENFKLNLENLENDNIKCKLEIENLMKELAQSNQMCKAKQGELENLKGLYDTLSGNYEKLNTENKRHCRVIQSSSQLLLQLKAQKQDLVAYVSATQQAILGDILSALERSENLKTMRTEQEDLLKEMALMNENLKGRGEKIYSLNEEINSLREATCSLEREKCAVEANLNAMTQEMKDLKEELREEKDVQRRMSEEIEKIKEDAKKKEEEFQRKQELLVSTATQSASQEELVTMVTQSESQAEPVTIVTQSASSADMDNKMETLSTSTLSRADESNRMKDIEDTYEDRYIKLKLLTIKYKKSYVETNEKLATVTSENTALIQKLQALSSQIKTASIVQAEYDSLCEKFDAATKLARQKDKTLAGYEAQVEGLEKKVEQLRGSLAEVTEQRNELQVKHAQLREKFDEQQASDIIMKEKDHEITKLSDTNAYLSGQIVELRARLAQYHAKNLEISQYEKRIAVLEEMKAELQAKLNSLEDVNDQLESLNATHSALVTSHAQLQEEHRAGLAQLSALGQNYEAAQWRVEELVAETTRLSGDKQRLGELRTEMGAVQSRLKEAEAETVAVKLEKANLLKEFEAYKRKAQSVLEKQKRGQMDASCASVEESNAKLTSLEKQIDTLKAELNQSKSDLTHAKQSLALAQAEKENLASQLEHTTSELSDKVTTVDTLKQEKINADMMIIMYKQQVDESRDQINSLKQTLADLRAESGGTQQRLPSAGDKESHPNVGRNVLLSSGDKESHPHLGRNVSPRQERWSDADEMERRRIEDVLNSNSFVESLNNMASLYREEGEGSEYTDTPGLGSHVPIPLDELLSSNEDQFQHEEDILTRLSSCQSQVLHLTTLLNESENNAARHEQQTNFLKEEIRRLQRTVDRQPHVQNSEYLKNVIIKFLTLQGGDERQRLVPVLNTMLKLSPEEVKQLSGVAKGYSAEASGWSSLLGGWSTSSTT